MTEFIWQPGTTYDDWLVRGDRLRKDVTIESVDLRTPLTLYKSQAKKELSPGDLPEDVFLINVPLLSAPMQSVTGPKTSVELAKHGGLGVIFCSQPVESEAEMVRAVKDSKAGFVIPDVFSPNDYIHDVVKRAGEKGYSTFPVTHNGNPDGKLIGLLTKNDFSHAHSGMKVKDRMVPFDRLVYATHEDVGDDLRKANAVLEDSHHGSIPIIDRQGKLKYMVFKKDVREHKSYPIALVDEQKRYKVGAAINTQDYKRRVPAVLDAGADILFIDSSNGYSDYQAATLGYITKNFPGVFVIGGNVGTKEGFDFLVEHGAHGVKLGMGPGSICTTRDKFRIGTAQATNVMEVAARRDEYLKETGIYVPIISDGGFVFNNHFFISPALGADSSMAGRFFAQFNESPTNLVDLKEEHEGHVYTAKAKPYWGEGSERAKAWRKKRYHQMSEAEGIEGHVPYAGPMGEEHNLPRTLYHLRTSLQKCGYRDISELHARAKLQLESASSKKEGKPHDVFAPKMWAPYSAKAW